MLGIASRGESPPVLMTILPGDIVAKSGGSGEVTKSEFGPSLIKTEER